jgi:hypothetical protein
MNFLNLKFLPMAVCLLALPLLSQASPSRGHKAKVSAAAASAAPKGKLAQTSSGAPTAGSPAEALPGLPRDVTEYILAYHADAPTRGRFAATSPQGAKVVQGVREYYGADMKDATMSFPMIKKIGTTSMQGGAAYGVISHDHKRLFVLNNKSHAVTEVDLATFKAQKPIKLSHTPVHGMLSQDGKELFVVGDTILSIIDTTNGKVIQSIKLPHTTNLIVLGGGSHLCHSPTEFWVFGY